MRMKRACLSLFSIYIVHRDRSIIALAAVWPVALTTICGAGHETKTLLLLILPSKKKRCATTEKYIKNNAYKRYITSYQIQK